MILKFLFHVLQDGFDKSASADPAQEDLAQAQHDRFLTVRCSGGCSDHGERGAF